MNGLGVVNIELSSLCQKKCPMCGRRKLEREFPNLVNWGNMEFGLVKDIASQIPSGVVCQFHLNGESLLHPRFGECVSLFKHTIRCMDTNGKLLLEKADEIIGNLETLTISVVEGDEEGEEQYGIVEEFIRKKGNRKPNLIYRLLGMVDRKERWLQLSGLCAFRILHLPEGSRGYKRPVTIPEIGICLDLLTHLAIDRFGNVSHCVRFDPEGLGRIGHVSEGIEAAWNSPNRMNLIQEHIKGNRKVGLCARCDYWGVPRGE